jgi:hypothetical protein
MARQLRPVRDHGATPSTPSPGPVTAGFDQLSTVRRLLTRGRRVWVTSRVGKRVEIRNRRAIRWPNLCRPRCEPNSRDCRRIHAVVAPRDVG